MRKLSNKLRTAVWRWLRRLVLRCIDEYDVQWIVNDNAELGVMLGGRCFFLYKGGSLEYSDGTHDDGSPMLIRPVGKREFGECCHPLNWKGGDRYTENLVYTPGLSFGKPDDGRWRPISSQNNSDH